MQSVPVAGPITYTVNGKQYIAVNAGWNNAIVHGLNQWKEAVHQLGRRGSWCIALDAKGVKLPPAPPARGDYAAADYASGLLGKVREGATLFAANCAGCHGQNAIGSGPKDPALYCRRRRTRTSMTSC